MKATVVAVVATILVASTSATPTAKCPLENEEDVTLIANLDDCKSYYSCVSGIPYLMRCPEGLEYNPVERVCDIPEHAGCRARPPPPSADLTSRESIAGPSPSSEGPLRSTRPPPHRGSTAPDEPAQRPTESPRPTGAHCSTRPPRPTRPRRPSSTPPPPPEDLLEESDSEELESRGWHIPHIGIPRPIWTPRPTSPTRPRWPLFPTWSQRPKGHPAIPETDDVELD